MRLVNALGQVVLDNPLSNEIRLNEFEPGMYIIKVYDPSSQRSLYRKLMVVD
jgi:hypothetical protein